MDIIDAGDACEWHLEDQFWTQDGQGAFQLRSHRGVPLPEALGDLDFLIATRRCPRCRVSAFLPAAFRHCPHCGAPLGAPGETQPWLPPYGQTGGWRCHERAGSPAGALLERLLARPGSLDEHRQVLKAPRKGGLLYFAAPLGGHGNALFALSRAGELFLWQRSSEQWLSLVAEQQPLGGFDLELWAWGLALLDTAAGPRLLLAGTEGATSLCVDPLQLSYRLQRCSGRALGAPGELEGRVYVPLLQDGRVLLADSAGEAWSSRALEDIDAPALQKLSAPILNAADRQLLWVGSQGYLELRLDDGAQAQVRWHAWPQGWQAYPEFGPPFRDGEGFWQQLIETERQAMCYVKLDGRLQERRLLQGTRMGTGHLSIQSDALLQRPWDEYDRNLHTQKQVFYPFMEFAAERLLLGLRVDHRSSVQKFFANPGPHPTDYCLERIDGERRSLHLSVERPWDAQWLVFDDALWLAIDSNGALYRWS